MVEDSSKKMIQQRQVTVRNALAVSREAERLRKADTRHKIQLGGLVVKAGLSSEPTNVLLGLLCEAKTNLETNRQRWQMLGSAIFEKEEKMNHETIKI